MRPKAIETRYQGCRFRSRLEARWAVWFDALEIPWRYELEGFDLGYAGWYLPDFWLPLSGSWQRPYPEGTPPECGFWVEIKPTVPSPDELVRLTEISRTTGHCAYLVAGDCALEGFRVWKMGPRADVMWEIEPSTFYCYLDEVVGRIGGVWGPASCPHCGSFQMGHGLGVPAAFDRARAMRFDGAD